MWGNCFRFFRLRCRNDKMDVDLERAFNVIPSLNLVTKIYVSNDRMFNSLLRIIPNMFCHGFCFAAKTHAKTKAVSSFVTPSCTTFTRGYQYLIPTGSAHTYYFDYKLIGFVVVVSVIGNPPLADRNLKQNRVRLSRDTSGRVL